MKNVAFFEARVLMLSKSVNLSDYFFFCLYSCIDSACSL